MASSADISCLQEHHLHKYEKKKFDELFPLHESDSRCHDEDAEPDPTHRASGMHGVVTLWKHHLDPYIKRSPEGNNRILVTTLEIPRNRAICIVNSYMPSGKSAEALDIFRECLDVVHELILKYELTHDIFLAGDINVDHVNRAGKKEELFKKLIKEHRLTDLGRDIQGEHTYINDNLGHASHLDHMLVKTRQSTQWAKCQIIPEADPRNATNVSTHFPITTKLKLSNSASAPKPPLRSSKKAITKYFWEECDTELYKSTLDESLQSMKLEALNPFHATHTFQLAIEAARAKSTPSKTINISKSGRKGQKWTPEIKAAEQKSKVLHHQWKIDGSKYSKQRKNQAKNNVKRIVNRQAKDERMQLFTEISVASENDPKLMNKLIKYQKQMKSKCGALLIHDKLVTDEDELREAWADYYEELGTPDSVDENLSFLLELARERALAEAREVCFSPVEVKDAISALNSGKAADIYGLAAEQFKNLSVYALQVLTQIINKIFNQHAVPENIKESFKIAIPKKDKSTLLQDNHRGITIAPTIGKIIEQLMLTSGMEEIPTNGLQVGFSYGRSPAMGTLIIAESISEARTIRVPLIVIPEDARKAFDVVCQQKLKWKLYHSDISRELWLMMDAMYSGGTERFRLGGEFSRPYTVLQGVKQGGKSSPNNYKCYIYDMLARFERAGLGFFIGPIYVGTPTCADDVALIASDGCQAQAMLDVSYAYSKEHKYDIHPVKTTATVMYEPKEEKVDADWLLGEDPLKNVDEFEHLGLLWRKGQTSPDIEEIISGARRRSYSLMSAGLHGENGLSPFISLKIIKTYILPKLLAGLDGAIISEKDVIKLEMYHRKLLRIIQGLPENTASCAVYLMAGTIPLRGLLHMRIMSLFGNISRLKTDTPLYRLALRQSSLASSRPNSWFTQLHLLGRTYRIDTHGALAQPWEKEPWKAHCKALITSHWHKTLLQDYHERKTLKHIELSPTPELRHPHPMWFAARMDPYLAPATAVRAKAMVGRLSLSYAPWKQDTICPLCETEPETMTHFIARCPSLNLIRTPLLIQLAHFYTDEGEPPPSSETEITSACLNGDKYVSDTLKEAITIKNDNAQNFCSRFCQKMYKERDYIINDKLMQ